jgi:glycosyltransferase involved in cell wall biosynthesis
MLEALAQNNGVISIEQISYTGEYKKEGVHYHFKQFTKLGRLFPLTLHRFIKKQKPEVVVIQSLHFPVQVILLRLCLGRKTKIMVQNHAEKPFAGLKRQFQKIADKFIDGYLFASYELGADWVKTGNIAAGVKIHEVMEVSSIFSPMDKAAAIAKTGVEGKPVFLWVGRLNANKAPLTVVKAFLRFAELHPPARLYMIYHTVEFLEDIREVINRSPQKDSIKLIGKIPHNDLQYWLSSSDIMVSGSYYEGSGTAVCEAMSCGCMPLVTDIPSFRMMTDKGRCGLLYEPGNEDALLSALQQTVTIDIEAKKQASFEYFKSNLSFGAIAAQIQEIASSL